MLTNRTKFLGVLILIISLTITMTACDTGNGVGDLVGENLEITGVEEISDKTVEYGTDFENINLPEEIEVTLNNNSTKILDVNWLEGDYDGETAGTYTIMGELDLTDDIKNPDDIYPTVQITVQEEGITLYSVSVDYDENDGTVKGDGDYEEGKEVELTATAKEDYEFVEWTGYVESTDRIITFDMSAKDVDLTAHFGGTGIFRADLNLTGAPGSETAYLHWNYIEEAEEYNIYRARSENGPYEKVEPEKPIVNTSYEKKGLRNNQAYYFKVTAKKQGVESEESNIIRITPERNKEIKIHEDLIILEIPDIEATKVISNDHFEFSNEAPQAEEIKAGNYLIFPTMEKTEGIYLKQVTSVEQINDGIVVRTENASLEDVLLESNIRLESIDGLGQAEIAEVSTVRGASFKEFPDEKDLGGTISIKQVPLVEYDGHTLVHLNGDVEVYFDLETVLDFNIIGDNELLLKPTAEMSNSIEVWLSVLDITNHENITSLEVEVGSVPVYHPIPWGPGPPIPAQTNIPLSFEIDLARLDTAVTSPLAYFSSTLKATGGVAYNIDMEDDSLSIGNWSIGGAMDLKTEFGFPMFDFGSMYEFDWTSGEVNTKRNKFYLEKVLNAKARPTLEIIYLESLFKEPSVGLAQFDMTLNDDENHLWSFEAPSGDIAMEVGTNTAGLDNLISGVPEDLSVEIEGDLGGLIPSYERKSVSRPNNLEVRKNAEEVIVKWDQVEGANSYEVYKNPLISLPGLRGEKLGTSLDTEIRIDKDSFSEGVKELGVVATDEIFGFMEYASLFSAIEEITIGDKDKYILEIDKIGKGTVSIDPDESEYEEGKDIELTAIPDDGWEFSQWEGEVTDKNSAETTVTMDEDKTVIAHFVEEDNGDEIVEFEDSNFEEVVREEINKFDGDLYSSDLIDINSLYAVGENIESIEGIQYLENLEWLSIGHNEISDISALENLNTLEDLFIGHNEAPDIVVLENLTNLKRLDIRSNEISDISILENLTDLERLFFKDNEISDISVLENLKNLQQLYFRSNEVSDISVLKNLLNLEVLRFNHNKVSDISVLENLNNLERLDFSNNEVSDISSLVKNDGFGTGDEIWMQNNYLDLTDDSEDMDDINVLIDRGVDVNYEPQNEPEETEYKLIIENEGEGTTNPAEGSHNYNEDETVNILASPDQGWEFSHWEGEVADPNSADTTITMNEDKTIIAYFVEEETEPIEPVAMVLVEAGSKNGLTVDEDFYINKNHVTQELFQEIMGYNPSNFDGNPDNPVENLDWYEAAEFCNKLSAEMGLDKYYEITHTIGGGITVDENPEADGYRLPEKNEHEFAARGGEDGKSTIFAGSNTLDDVGWYDDNTDTPRRVGQKQSNELNLYDMSGNLFDWTNTRTINIRGEDTSKIRGGSWSSTSDFCQVNYSEDVRQSLQADNVGFRIARNP